MKDRVPGAPGQYKAIISEGELQKMQAGEQFVITMTRDDQPIVEGTPYSKAAVLPDELAAQICPNIEDPTPAEALNALREAVANAKTKWTLLWQNASPTSEFVEQNFSLGDGVTTSSYHCLAVQFNHSTQYHFRHLVFQRSAQAANAIFPAGELSGLTLAETHRYVRWDSGNNNFYVGNGYRNGVQDDTACIPYAIYGINW